MVTVWTMTSSGTMTSPVESARPSRMVDVVETETGSALNESVKGPARVCVSKLILISRHLGIRGSYLPLYIVADRTL